MQKKKNLRAIIDKSEVWAGNTALWAEKRSKPSYRGKDADLRACIRNHYWKFT